MFLRSEKCISFLSMRKGPRCPVSNPKCKQVRECAMGCLVAVPALAEGSHPPISNSSSLWGPLKGLVLKSSVPGETGAR